MATITTLTIQEAQLVRGGCEADVTRLIRVGGRVVRRGNTLKVRDRGGTVLDIPFALIAFGRSRRRILILLSEDRQQHEG